MPILLLEYVPGQNGPLLLQTMTEVKHLISENPRKEHCYSMLKYYPLEPRKYLLDMVQRALLSAAYNGDYRVFKEFFTVYAKREKKREAPAGFLRNPYIDKSTLFINKLSLVVLDQKQTAMMGLFEDWKETLYNTSFSGEFLYKIYGKNKEKEVLRYGESKKDLCAAHIIKFYKEHALQVYAYFQAHAKTFGSGSGEQHINESEKNETMELKEIVQKLLSSYKNFVSYCEVRKRKIEASCKNKDLSDHSYYVQECGSCHDLFAKSNEKLCPNTNCRFTACICDACYWSKKYLEGVNVLDSREGCVMCSNFLCVDSDYIEYLMQEEEIH